MTLHEDLHDLMERVIKAAFKAGYAGCVTDMKGLLRGEEYRYSDWREHGPGALLPFGNAKPATQHPEGAERKVAQPKDTEAYKVLDELLKIGREDPPRVCAPHLTFAPCRHNGRYGSLCQYTEDQLYVATVYRYQRGLIDLVTADNIIQRLNQGEGI